MSRHVRYKGMNKKIKFEACAGINTAVYKT